MEITSISDSLSKKADFTEKAEKMASDLMESEVGLSYLEGRGLSKNTITHFGLGYNKEKNAISIPHYKRGVVVAIKYRFIEGDTRYGSEKGGMPWVFNEGGIDVGRNMGGILITEGEFDAMAAHQAGVRNVVSSGGADAIGTWIELLSTIPKIYTAFDNDDAGKKGSKKFAERIGIDKCFEVNFEDKDLSEFFKKNSIEKFREIIKEATPFYKYQFTGIVDIIEQLRTKTPNTLMSKFIPGVKMEKDWLVTVLADTNIGKTSYVLNIADEMSSNGIPTLVMPFEGGIEFVGKRFLQIKFNKSQDDFVYADNDEWDDIVDKCSNTPVYLSTPKKTEILDTLKKAKMLFDIQVVIVDHLDYLVRNVQGNRAEEIANTLQSLKRFGEDNKMLMIVVSHIKRLESGSALKRKPTLHDAKGSSSIEQDSQVVLVLSRPSESEMEVDVQKNKGPMRNGTYEINNATGKLIKEITTDFKT